MVASSAHSCSFLCVSSPTATLADSASGQQDVRKHSIGVAVSGLLGDIWAKPAREQTGSTFEEDLGMGYVGRVREVGEMEKKGKKRGKWELDSLFSKINLFIYLFIFGCVGSSFLCEGFL